MEDDILKVYIEKFVNSIIKRITDSSKSNRKSDDEKDLRGEIDSQRHQISSLQKLNFLNMKMITELRSKIIRQNDEITNIETIKDNFRKEINSKDSIIESLNKEIDNWHIKSSTFENLYTAKLNAANKKIEDLNLELQKAQNNSENIPIAVPQADQDNIMGDESDKSINSIEASVKVEEDLDCKGNDNELKQIIQQINNQFLKEKSELISHYKKVISDLNLIRNETPNDEMRFVVEKSIQEKLVEYLNECIGKDQHIINLQEDKLILEDEMKNYRDMWEKQEEKYNQKISSLERQVSSLSSSLENGGNTLYAKLNYLKQIFMKFSSSKDARIRQGLILVICELLEMSHNEKMIICNEF
ncbi:MAG: hypothetical protein MHMPM18_002376 [Marteilia pararefringens]